MEEVVWALVPSQATLREKQKLLGESDWNSLNKISSLCLSLSYKYERVCECESVLWKYGFRGMVSGLGVCCQSVFPVLLISVWAYRHVGSLLALVLY